MMAKAARKGLRAIPVFNGIAKFQLHLLTTFSSKRLSFASRERCLDGACEWFLPLERHAPGTATHCLLLSHNWAPLCRRAKRGLLFLFLSYLGGDESSLLRGQFVFEVVEVFAVRLNSNVELAGKPAQFTGAGIWNDEDS